MTRSDICKTQVRRLRRIEPDASGFVGVHGWIDEKGNIIEGGGTPGFLHRYPEYEVEDE